MLDMLMESGEFLRTANICNLANVQVIPQKKSCNSKTLGCAFVNEIMSSVALKETTETTTVLRKTLCYSQVFELDAKLT